LLLLCFDLLEVLKGSYGDLSESYLDVGCVFRTNLKSSAESLQSDGYTLIQPADVASRFHLLENAEWSTYLEILDTTSISAPLLCIATVYL
jgi:hypothetical protein